MSVMLNVACARVPLKAVSQVIQMCEYVTSLAGIFSPLCISMDSSRPERKRATREQKLNGIEEGRALCFGVEGEESVFGDASETGDL